MSSEITLFSKSDGPLTKKIFLAADGSIVSDGSACIMARGTAERIKIDSVEDFAGVIEGARSDQAIALGTLRPDLPAKLEVVTKQKLNGAVRPDVIARTGEFLVYQDGQPALVLLDHDTKGMPAEVAAKVEQLGGFWPAVEHVLPALSGVARVTRRSTSAGLFRSDSGERLRGSNGSHTYLMVADATDIERFLKDLHNSCWLFGLAWMMVGAGGQLLERSIIDRMVGAPERLVFEGQPILVPPLQQYRRRAVATDGDVLDTRKACPPLSIVENSMLRALKAKYVHQLASEQARARAAFIAAQAKDLAKRAGISERAAAQTIARQCVGVLLSNIVLPFDDAELEGCTVGDVLTAPERFEGATLADPLEGVGYGRCVARIMRRADGTPWIHSFAHGRTVYELKLDAGAVAAAMKRVDTDMVIKTLINLAMNADLDSAELEGLCNLAHQRTGTNKRTVAAMLKEALEKQAEERAEEERKRYRAERRDPRPMIDVPLSDDPWLPQMDVLNEVIGNSAAAIPPMRDIDGAITKAIKIAAPDMHAFTDANPDNQEEHTDAKATTA